MIRHPADRCRVQQRRVGCQQDDLAGGLIAAQVLFCPVTDASRNTSSYQRYADGPWLTREAMCWF